MWTDKNRAKYDRDHLRYPSDPSDLTDDEWAYVEPLIPPARRGGGKRRVDMRAVMNGVMYILSTGCPDGLSGCARSQRRIGRHRRGGLWRQPLPRNRRGRGRRWGRTPEWHGLRGWAST